MKTKLRIVGWLVLLALSMFNLQLSTAHAQGTAFTYQGRLNNGANPTTGIYDLRFTIYDAVTNGSVVAGPLTNAATGVTNGLFTATLDFGSVFNGTAFVPSVSINTSDYSATGSITCALDTSAFSDPDVVQGIGSEDWYLRVSPERNALGTDSLVVFYFFLFLIQVGIHFADHGIILRF